ncbi:hypothetical protein [Mesobacillus zeae]|uniref:hypothetical protein n=1 Tax=Mesobacillus zeae TaxID=1917180 RepID=UPI003008C6D1
MINTKKDKALEDEQDKQMIEVSKAELLLIKSIRDIDSPDELVRIGSGVDSSEVKNSFLCIAADKLS